VPTDEGAGANADAQSEVNSEAKQNVIRTESGDKGRNSENKPHDIPGASDAKSDRSNKE
jgi:hypothetical protein